MSEAAAIDPGSAPNPGAPLTHLVASAGTEAQVAALAQPALASLGFELVRVRLMGKVRKTLQVMIERFDDKAISVEDCAIASRDLSALFDVADLVAGAYDLELSSAGLDRPLVRLADFDRHAGAEVKLETRLAVDGRKRFKGRLEACEGSRVKILTETGSVAIAFADLVSAKLVLTDELVAAALKGRPPAAEA